MIGFFSPKLFKRFARPHIRCVSKSLYLFLTLCRYVLSLFSEEWLIFLINNGFLSFIFVIQFWSINGFSKSFWLTIDIIVNVFITRFSQNFSLPFLSFSRCVWSLFPLYFRWQLFLLSRNGITLCFYLSSNSGNNQGYFKARNKCVYDKRVLKVSKL